jgi:hypothetical protein
MFSYRDDEVLLYKWPPRMDDANRGDLQKMWRLNNYFGNINFLYQNYKRQELIDSTKYDFERYTIFRRTPTNQSRVP